MSIESALTLCKRSFYFLESAKSNYRRGYYDVACVEAEIADQLLVKALYNLMGYEHPRSHRIRELLSSLAMQIDDTEISKAIRQYIRDRRKELIILEDSRRMGQYDLLMIDHDRAPIAMETANEVYEMLKNIWIRIYGGWCID